MIWLLLVFLIAGSWAYVWWKRRGFPAADAPKTMNAAKNDAVQGLPSGPLPWRLPLVRAWLHIESATIHHQTEIPCWNFYTEGMSVWKQQELVLCIARLPGEDELDFPKEILSLFQAIARSAAEGKVVGSGGYSRLRKGVMRDDFRGILYTDAIALSGHTVPADHLRMVLVTSEELEMACTTGVTRVLSLIGGHHHFFPTAPWVDRGRPALRPEGPEPTLLNRLPRQSISGHISVISAGMCVMAPAGSDVQANLPKAVVVWSVVSGAHPDLADLLQSLPQCCLMLLDPLCDAALCWVPSRPGMNMIARAEGQGRRIGANFLVLATNAKDQLLTVEDGLC